MPDNVYDTESLWPRIKNYIDLSKLTAGDETNQQIQLTQAIQSSSNENIRRLGTDKFSKEAIKIPGIRQQLVTASKTSYEQNIKGFEKVKEGKLITIKKGKLAGYEYIQFRGMKNGRNVISGNFYLKKKEG